MTFHCLSLTFHCLSLTFHCCVQAVSAELALRFGAAGVGTHADIKRNIDRLIDREYLSRSADDMAVYVYLP